MFFLKYQINSNPNSLRKSMLPLAIFCFIAPITFCFTARADGPGVVKKKYKHVCPAGAEQVGDGPPKSSIVFCRAVLNNGYRLEGDYVSFYRNGNIKMQGEYVGGKRDGNWYNYRKNGQVMTTTEYRNGNKIRKPIERKTPEPDGRNNSNTNKIFYNDKDVQQKLFETRKRSYSNNGKNIVYGISGN